MHSPAIAQRRIFPVALGLALLAPAAGAVPFGIPDARGMALGGAAVALANSRTAAFYNPALLARHAGEEDDSGENSLTVPILSGVVADQAFDFVDYEDQNFHDQLRAAMTEYNSSFSSAAAQRVANISSDLNNALNDLANENAAGDLHAGLAIAIPSLAKGGSFFVVSRAVGIGRIDLTEHDKALLDAYVEGMTFVASGGTQGSEQPQLFDDNGQLLDLTDTLDSIIRGTGLLSTEVGVALSNTAHVGKHELHWGVAPKIQSIATYDYLHTVHDDNATVTRSDTAKTRLNVDLGAAAAHGDHWLAGLSIKNLIPRDVPTARGEEIELRPNVRAGIAYATQRYVVGADLDMLPNPALAIEDDNQFLGLGAELNANAWLSLRGGIKVDMRNASTHNLLSAGLGVAFKRGFFDIAVGKGSSSVMFAAQLGFLF